MSTTYLPPGPAILNSFLAAQSPGTAADHHDVAGLSVRVRNTLATQQGTVLGVSLSPGPVMSGTIRSILDQSGATVLQRIVRLTIGDIPAPADRTSYLQVFLGRSVVTPANAANHPNHFRDVAFFCCHGGGPFSFLFDVTGHLQKLRGMGESPDRSLTVQVLAASLRGPAPAIIPGWFELNAATI